MATIIFLKMNGCNLRMEQKRLEDFTVDVVKKEYDFDMIAVILKECSIKREE